MRRRCISLLCVLSLLAALLIPIRATEDVCFTAVNDRILPLTAGTMPMWSSGMLYVPYSVFDSGSTGVSMGTSSTYSKSSGVVSIFNLQEMMVFDLEAGTCVDLHTGNSISARAVSRNGTAYVPVSQVCAFFGLNYTYLNTDYGYLVRITNFDKSDERTLSDSRFIDAGSNIMKNRLRDYKQALAQEQEQIPAVPTQPAAPAQPEPSAIPTMLAVRCDGGESALSMAQTLESFGLTALFFFPAQEVGANGALIRRLLGVGHSVGMLAEGESAAQTLELLEQGRQSLATVAHSRTFFSLVPEGQLEQVRSAGWACWTGVDAAATDAEESSYLYVQEVLRSLPKAEPIKLTLDDSQLSAHHLSTLLRQLENSRYDVIIPRETYL